MRMPLADLVSACRKETVKSPRGEPCRDDACFELMRRAVCLRDEQAWEAIVTMYWGMVLVWVRQHPAAVASDEDYCVNCAFERFWHAVGPDRFHLFGNIASLLKYLKMCAHSVLLDEARSRRAAPLGSLEELVFSGGEALVMTGNAEALVVNQLAGRELWATIIREIPDESGRLVTYLSFALGMKPGEIHERYSERFPTVAEVYKIKRNVLDRLRRSPAVRAFLG